MPTSNATITIGGTEVEIDNPCAVLTELRKAEIMVAAGEAVAMTRFGEDEVRFTQASGGRLESLITKYEGLCDRANGKRRRGARAVRWRA